MIIKYLKTPKAFNVNNPVQAANGGAARGEAMQHTNSVLRRSTTRNRQVLNSYGVQMLIAASLPRAALRLHGVIHIERLRRVAKI